MKKPHLVARADQHGVYIAATGEQPAQFYKHRHISVCTPKPKARPDKAIEMAYKSFVYARGRFTPGGMDKYEAFRNGKKKKEKKTEGFRRDPNGAVRLINAVFLLLSGGPSHGHHGNKIHNFRLVRA